MDAELADVGSPVVRKAFFLFTLLAAGMCLQACASDTVSYQQQKDKADALQKVADSEKDPNRENRGSR